MGLRRLHYQNLTNPSPRLSRMAVFKLELKKLFTMKNIHKIFMTLIIGGFFIMLYTAVAGIWKFNPTNIINFNGKLVASSAIIFVVFFIIDMIVFQWDDIEEMFDFRDSNFD
jgi:polyferredoxin